MEHPNPKQIEVWWGVLTKARLGGEDWERGWVERIGMGGRIGLRQRIAKVGHLKRASRFRFGGTSGAFKNEQGYTPVRRFQCPTIDFF